MRGLIMLKMKKMVMVVMIVFVSCLLMAMAFEVRATSDNNPIDISGNIDITVGGGNETTNSDLNSTTNQAGNAQVIQPITNTDANVAGDTLPQTGVTEDITVMFFIVICVVSAIYAYKKIRDYKE